MVTYPSTHGVFEAAIKEGVPIVHQYGGQVYMDGANMNAQVGLCRPGDIGADVCHLNLHKTFCIPHGGGGPGMGPIGVAEHLAPILPTHPVVDVGIRSPRAPAPYRRDRGAAVDSADLVGLHRDDGARGLTLATKVAILSANYIAKRLQEGGIRAPVSGQTGLVAHECIIDTRPFKASAGVEVEDIAKRLIDYGFHPPTVSFPVAGTLMVEPTESERESRARPVHRRVDRDSRRSPRDRNARGRSREQLAEKKRAASAGGPAGRQLGAAYSARARGLPTAATREHKIWPPVSRIDAAFGDRNLVCTCPPVEAYATV
jgi:glycine dehydrogenase